MADSHEERLLQLLAGIDFGRRYYAYYESARARGKLAGYTDEDLQEALSATPLSFTYNRRERFYRHAEPPTGGLTVALNVAFRASAAEFILDLRTPAGRYGGPFKGLANRLERRRDPAFAPSPPYPDLPFSTAAELRDVLAFGTGLYVEAREAILGGGDWETA